MSDDLAQPPLANRFLPELSDSDHDALQSAVSELFQRQAIVRDLPGDKELYDWARLHFPWVKEVAALIGFQVVINEDDQMIYALPGEKNTLRRLRAEWTLVLLALWYDYDVQVRTDGPPVHFSVEAFNESLRTKLGDRMPTISALKEMLAFFAARKLVRMEYADDFHRSTLEVLPTIRFVLPFGELEKVAATLDELMARTPATSDNPGEDHHG